MVDNVETRLQHDIFEWNPNTFIVDNANAINTIK